MKQPTLKNILKELSPEFHEWVRNKEREKSFHIRPVEWLQDYLRYQWAYEGKVPSSKSQEYDPDRQLTLKKLIRACNYLGHWYINVFQDKALNEGVFDQDTLALSMKHYSRALPFHYYLTPEFPHNPPVMTLERFAQILTAPTIQGDRARAVWLYRLMLELLIGDEDAAYHSHFWFLLHLLADWQGEEIDTARYDYPEDMKIYGEILPRWRTQDQTELDQLVYKLADFHIQESVELEDSEDVPEFDDRDFWLFPYEIHAMLRLREWVGLENPKELSHPLMQLVQNRLPRSLPDVETPLLDQAVAKFEKEFDVEIAR